MPILTKDGRGVLFIHVPKTGGSSIENHFVKAGWTMSYHDGRVGEGTLNNYLWCTPQHMHGAMLRENFRIDRFDAVFMVVREPIARFRSEYVWRQGKDVDTSAHAVERWAEKIFARQKRSPFVMGNHIRPQVEFLVEGTRVFRFEDGLEPAVVALNEEFDLGLPSKLPRVRTSQKTSGVASSDVEISAPLEKRLRRFYAKDIRQFGY